MTSPIKSDLDSKQLTGALQLVHASSNVQRDNGDHAIRATDVFAEKRKRSLPFTLVQRWREPLNEPAEVNKVADSENLSSAICDAAPDSILTVDHNCAILSFNSAAERTFRISKHQALGKEFIETLIAHGWGNDVRQAIERTFSGTEDKLFSYRTEVKGRRADGSIFPAELALTPLDSESSPTCAIFIRDISERKRAEALQSGQNHILNLIATGSPLQNILSEIASFAEHQSVRGLCSICRFNNDERSPALAQLSARSDYAAQIDGIIPGYEFHHSTTACDAEAVHAPRSIRAPIWTTGRSHAARHSFGTCASWPIFGKSRKVFGTLALHFSEATTPTAHEDQVARICTRLAGIAIERIGFDEKMRYLAHYDRLTALPNRFLFDEYLSLAFRNARRSGKKFALFFVDLDKFKEINDTLGHAAGDLVLQEVAVRMRDCLRNSDKIARMGGDEFYVLVEGLNDGCHAADIADKLLGAASRPLQTGGKEHRLSASIGISIYPDDGRDSQTLLQNADCAMYRAKELGKNRYHFFSTQHLCSNTVPPLVNGPSRSAGFTENR